MKNLTLNYVKKQAESPQRLSCTAQGLCCLPKPILHGVWVRSKVGNDHVTVRSSGGE